MHPSGKYLYVSNRGHNSVVLFAIDADKGTLSFVEEQGTGGKTPRPLRHRAVGQAPGDRQPGIGHRAGLPHRRRQRPPEALGRVRQRPLAHLREVPATKGVRQVRTLPVAACLAVCVGPLLAAGPALAAPPGEPVLLWNKVAPGSEGKTGAREGRHRDDGVRRVSSIHRPSLTPHLPAKGTGNGAAVIILPGRRPPLPGHRQRGAPGGQLAERPGHRRLRAEVPAGPRGGLDLQGRAARAVRTRSGPSGWCAAGPSSGASIRRGSACSGFSAGGQVTSYAAARFDAGKPGAPDAVERESSRPAFQGLMYAGAAPPDVVVPKDAPPAFICVAADDKNPTQQRAGDVPEAARGRHRGGAARVRPRAATASA